MNKNLFTFCVAPCCANLSIGSGESPSTLEALVHRVLDLWRVIESLDDTTERYPRANVGVSGRSMITDPEEGKGMACRRFSRSGIGGSL